MKVHRTLVHRGLSAQMESVFHLSAAVSVSTRLRQFSKRQTAKY